MKFAIAWGEKKIASIHYADPPHLLFLWQSIFHQESCIDLHRIIIPVLHTVKTQNEYNYIMLLLKYYIHAQHSSL